MLITVSIMQGWQKQYFFEPQPVVEHRAIVVWLCATKAFSYHMFLICFEPPDVLSRGNRKTCEAVLPSQLGYHHSGEKTEPSGSLHSTWKPDETHTTLQFSKFKDKNEVSTTSERLTGWEVLSSSWSPQGFNWALPELAQETTSSCKTEKKNLNSITVYVFYLPNSYFYLEDLGIFPRAGAEPGLIDPGLCSEALHTALPPAPLEATYILCALFVFVDHVHQWSFHHLHFIA